MATKQQFMTSDSWTQTNRLHSLSPPASCITQCAIVHLINILVIFVHSPGDRTKSTEHFNETTIDRNWFKNSISNRISWGICLLRCDVAMPPPNEMLVSSHMCQSINDILWINCQQCKWYCLRRYSVVYRKLIGCFAGYFVRSSRWMTLVSVIDDNEIKLERNSEIDCAKWIEFIESNPLAIQSSSSETNGQLTPNSIGRNKAKQPPN